MTSFEADATELLRELTGRSDAGWRDGQLDAIRAIVEERANALVVQRTGWGKSAVYLISTRLIRDDGGGPTVIVSPLVALMRNQLAMTHPLGLDAEATPLSATSGIGSLRQSRQGKSTSC